MSNEKKIKYKSYSQLKRDLHNSSRESISLYLDMDGVFCGFEEAIHKIFPDFEKLNRKFHDELKTEEDRILFKNMTTSIVNDKRFWADLPWEPGGKELFNFLKSNRHRFENISILTSPLKSDPSCISGKQEWVMKHFKGLMLDAFYADSKKWDYVNRQSGKLQILIDDRPKNINLWKENSGIGILHSSKNIKQTLDILKKYI